MFNFVFVTFPCCILGQVWYLIELISDLCHLSYFEIVHKYSIFSESIASKIDFELGSFSQKIEVKFFSYIDQLLTIQSTICNLQQTTISNFAVFFKNNDSHELTYIFCLKIWENVAKFVVCFGHDWRFQG